MNGTPRLQSAFPQTPQTLPRQRKLFETPSRSQPRDLRNVKSSPSKSPAKAPAPKPSKNDTNRPLVPVDVVDAPSQRLYVVAFYLVLNMWRIYESWTASDELDSTWLFLKWVSIDGIFLFGLQALRIPWLEWAFPTTLALLLLHVVGNVFLMFQIPVSPLAFDFAEKVRRKDETNDTSCHLVHGSQLCSNMLTTASFQFPNVKSSLVTSFIMLR